MTPQEAEDFQNDRYELVETYLGIDIWLNTISVHTFECTVYDSKLGINVDLISPEISVIKQGINEILAYNFYESLNVISDSLDEKKKDFNNPVSNYENVVNAFLKKVNDSFL